MFGYVSYYKQLILDYKIGDFWQVANLKFFKRG